MTDYDVYVDETFFARYTTKNAALKAAISLASSDMYKTIYIIAATGWNRINIKGYK